MTSAPSLGRFILAYDEFLQRSDLADLAPLIRGAFQTAGYTWLLDQNEAAAVQVYEGMTQAAAAVGEGVVNLAPSQHPDWVRLGLLAALITWCSGKSGTCTHVPNPMRPQPVAAAAWKPNLVVCDACRHLLSIPRGSAKDRTCDGCGVITEGIDHGDPIWPVSVAHGGFVYLVGVCASCRYWEE
ncbi:hypothetical protein AB0395_45445 [Streptosporangium sp. NPDC051023]|uniref:zinc finger domain-containing protein n=1 Tax=Streptosporangium sp. NPDC051023 TaxID=3155410 RepID=UPI00344D9E2D